MSSLIPSHTDTPAKSHPRDDIQPVVLTGGKSRRFGRDKLIELIDHEPLVARPIRALREVFGPRVAVVGACDARVEALADCVFSDPYPGMGPVGGIRAAFDASKSDVFVCAGDLIHINTDAIASILSVATSQNDADAVIACGHDGRMHPTLGLYRCCCTPVFDEALITGRLKLTAVCRQLHFVGVEIDDRALCNVNTPGDLVL